jgi:Putative DNA-binding domain
LQDQVSRAAFERLVHVRGEGDDWDFKATLGDLSKPPARVNLAKDALAFCNLSAGGTIIVGVTDDFERNGLAEGEALDTTAIRQAVEKYIDGDFTVLAAEHTLTEDGESESKRFGIVHFRRRSTQPVLAALDGQITNDKPPLFRPGDILIRRGAASIRANSGDVRRLLTSSVVHEAQVRAVDELWTCTVEQRRLLGGLEYLYDIFYDLEYPEVVSRPDLRGALGSLSEGQHASRLDGLQLRVNLVRPHIPDELYQQYRACAAFVGRLQMKAIRQRDAGIFVSWTVLDDGRPDLPLRQLASELLTSEEIEALWAGQATDFGTHRPLRPAIDATERDLLTAIRQILSGMG